MHPEGESHCSLQYKCCNAGALVPANVADDLTAYKAPLHSRAQMPGPKFTCSLLRMRVCKCRYLEDEPKPAQLPNTFWGWILPVWRATQEEVITVAGTDGAVYLMMLKFGGSQTCVS